ncbi:MAG TPA: MTH895/ArsE family thioredoxin-like protein, partial [Candidatus Dojkabacteria bacterium]|nr:MTH895/ArsE family thioredoxin-like protein [Candidatus Dojkabacteria bacterium]
MNIQVLGSGCTNCKNLFELTKRAVAELNRIDEVEYITDVNRIIEMGLVSTPVLAINSKPVMVGATADIER